MFDSMPQNDPAHVVGPNGAFKVSLGPGLGQGEWDAIFGAGTAEALAEQRPGLDARGGWTRQGWFRRCADIRAKAVSNLPWAIYPQGADADAEPLWRESDPSAPEDLAVLADLVHWLYLSEASLGLSGAFYFGKQLVGQGERVRRSRLQRLAGLAYWSPQHCKPDWKTGALRFERSVNGQVRYVDEEAVLYGWQPDPWVEMGPGSPDAGAALANAGALNAMARFLGRHLDNGLLKMTVLAIEDGQTVTEEQASGLRRAWRRLLRLGGNSSDGPPVLRHNVKPHVIGEGLKELSNEQLTTEQRQEISTAFGIPWSKVMGESANYATAQVEERAFLLDTVIPQARIIEGAFNKRLLSGYGLQIAFEPERSEVMQAYELEKAEKVQVLVGRPILGINEGRELLGYEPIKENETPEPEPQEAAEDRPPVRSLAEKLDALVGEPEAR